jgi:trans-2,3-dihydro-3-hydroxyanthranilate isomerase
MLNYFIVDAFTKVSLRGNPVAVFMDADRLTPELMQKIARELNLSETTFVRTAKSDGDAEVRIFTPVNELDFAGHPILGTAIALSRATGRPHLRLETNMGVVPIDVTDQGDYLTASMYQPVPTWKPFEPVDELLAAAGVRHTRAPVEVYHNGPRHVLVVVDTMEELSALHPDHRALGQFADLALNCVAGDGDRWRNRMFSPAYGVVEDAATGSAAGPIAIHLARHGLAPYGRAVDIEQGVEMGRPSLMTALAEGVGDSVSRVRVSGDGTMTGSGTLAI